MPKLRFVIGSLDVGGAERHLLYILPKLKELGWNIKVITLNSRGALANEMESKGVSVDCPEWVEKLSSMPAIVRRPARLLASMLRLIISFIKDPKTPVHFFLPESVVLGMCAAVITGLPAPKIMSRRSMNDYQKRRPLIGWLERKLHQHLDFALGNSQAVVNQLAEEGIPKAKTGLIYNGIDEPTLKHEQIREQLQLSKDTLAMAIVANLIPYKGHRDLLNALGSIKDTLPSWQLLCIGNDRGILSQLQSQAEQLGIASNIKWIQNVQDVSPYWQASDIGLLCSHEEGFSNAILEAMAHSIPTIVTDVGGNAEAVLDQQSGLVVPAKDPAKLAAAISTLANNPVLCKNYGQVARQRFENCYTAKLCVTAYDDFYKSMMEKPSAKN